MKTSLQQVVRGLKVACYGFVRRFSHKDATVHKAYWEFIKRTYSPVLIICYIISLGFALILFPITLPVLYFMPTIWHTFITIIPVWALYFAEMYNPMSTHKLFLTSIHSLDATLAQKFEQEAEEYSRQPFSWCTWIRSTIWEQVYFASCIAACFLLSFIPILGHILSYFIYTYMISQMLSWRLLDVYLNNISHWSGKTQNKFMYDNSMLLLGFCIPYVALTSVPILGPLLLGYAKASIADLIYEELYTAPRDLESGEIVIGKLA